MPVWQMPVWQMPVWQMPSRPNVQTANMKFILYYMVIWNVKKNSAEMIRLYDPIVTVCIIRPNNVVLINKVTGP